MRRKLWAFLPALVLAGALAGCGPDAPEATPGLTPDPTPVPTQRAEAEQEAVDIAALPNGSFLEGMERYKEIDLDGEAGGLYGVALYTTARRDEMGDFQWDDGQEFALAVQAQDGFYPLIPRNYVQLGDVDFTSFVDGDTGEFHVLVQVTQGAGVEVYDFTYLPQEQVFRRREVYRVGNADRVQSPRVLDGVFLGSYAGEVPAYQYDGKSDVTYGDRHFKLEDLPENAAEGLVALYYRYDISGAYDKLGELIGETPGLQISVDNTRESAEEGVYMREYVLHALDTLTREEVAAADYDTQGFDLDILQRQMPECALAEFVLVRADVSMAWSEKALERGPQIGDGRYTRYYLCGREAGGDDWKIYEVIWG